MHLKPAFAANAVYAIPAPRLLVLEVVRVEELLLRPLDLLTGPHDLDQLLPTFWWSDHDGADQVVVLEKELAVELLFKAVRAHRLEAGLHVGRHAHNRERRSEHRR